MWHDSTRRVRPTGRLAVGAVVGVAVGSVLTACSSASGGGGSSSDEIRVMTMIPIDSQYVSFPGAKTAAEARIKAINAAGGFAGKTVKLDVCDTKADPNAEPACVRQAVANKDVAIVGALTVVPATYRIIESAGIPVIGGWAILPQDFSTPNVYHFTSGVPGWYGGIAAMGKQLGVTTIGLVQCDAAACVGAGKTVTSYANSAGIKTVSTETAPIAVPDVTAIVSKVVATNPDAIVLAVVTSQSPKVLTALRQAGYRGKIITNTGGLNTAAIKASGDAADGVYVTAQVKPATETSDAGVAQYASEMKAEDPSATLEDNSEIVWGSFYLWEQLGKTLAPGSEVTSKSITTALQNMKTPLQTGVAGPFSTSEKSPVDSLPHLYSDVVYANRISGGSLTPYESGSIDFLQALGQ